MRLKVALVAAALLSAVACGHQGSTPTPAPQSPPAPGAYHRITYLPNRTTPGALNPAVTQQTLATTVCVAGWSTQQRQKYAPSYITDKIRDSELAGSYSYEHLASTDVEEDHRVPISSGGALADPKNLWPEPHVTTGYDHQAAGSVQKDGLEWYAYRHLCGKASPTITLATAQSYFLGNWYHWYVKLGRPNAPAFFH